MTKTTNDAPAELPDADTIDPAAIPYGERVLTKQGYVESTRLPPQKTYPPHGERPYKGW